ncbi:hypothetical protein [Kiloniella antarctica]|uniref:DUF4331 domain-containing protein n=1 Tax=Kiloniella antarctica TaxID=1550907 RepID=A0ABW5BHW0_9PROT
MHYDSDKPVFNSKSKVREVSSRIYEVEPVESRALANDLVSFDLSVDSVVATATLEYDSSHRFVTLFWGDSDVGETLDIRKIRNSNRVVGGNPLPENTIRVQHVYDVPAPPNRGSNFLFYTVLQDGEGRRSFGPAQQISVIPRYEFILRPVILEFNSHLDGALEQETEISIDMIAVHAGERIFHKHWEPDVVTNGNLGPLPTEERFPVFYKLTGSQLRHDIPLDSEDGIVINFVAKERENTAKDAWEFLVDVFTAEFDDSVIAVDNGQIRGFHPIKNTGPRQEKRYLGVQDGYFEAIMNIEMNLIVPLDRAPGQVVSD